MATHQTGCDAGTAAMSRRRIQASGVPESGAPQEAPRGLSNSAAAVRCMGEDTRTEGMGVHAMWDTIEANDAHLSHDLPCPQCGHAAHSYLPCSDTCDCVRSVMPGSLSTVDLAA
jgi:hypothetical protein